MLQRTSTSSLALAGIAALACALTAAACGDDEPVRGQEQDPAKPGDEDGDDDDVADNDAQSAAQSGPAANVPSDAAARPGDVDARAPREPATGLRDGGSAALDARVAPRPVDAASSSGDAATGARCTQPVGPVPDAVRQRLKLDPFYKKYIDANGLAVLSSDAPEDRALVAACELLHTMLSKRDDVRLELIRRNARFAIIGAREGTADIPEYGYRERTQADRDMINQRARGLAGQVASCGEENILCLRGDRYANESICTHEFSHTITTYGAYGADRTFQQRLMSAYQAASASGILDNTYRKENLQEYWAEGAQDWFDTNASAMPTNGVHNQVNTREELRTYDPALYELNEEMFPAETRWGDCHRR
jgi:alpha-glucosidase